MKKNLKTIGIFCLFMCILGLWGNNIMRSAQELFQNISGIELNEYVRWYSVLFMRKLVHVAGFLWLFKKIAKKSTYTHALGLIILLACLDEGLQVFIPGRTASWIDIALDIIIPITFTIVHMSKIGTTQKIEQNTKKPSIA